MTTPAEHPFVPSGTSPSVGRTDGLGGGVVGRDEVEGSGTRGRGGGERVGGNRGRRGKGKDLDRIGRYY